ncbi:MAG: hypothetical protein AAGD92_13825 [Pseudomonadota bacterium]
MRKLTKILHTVAAGGLIGGLACYLLLLGWGPQDTPVALADTRRLIAAVSNWVLLPSLGIALVSGLLAMVVHTPFLDKGWVWIKALLGILMFKGVLILVVAEANRAAKVSAQLANGEEAGSLFTSAQYAEGWAIGAVLALSIANVVLGVWRPRLMRPTPAKSAVKQESAAPPTRPTVAAVDHAA